MLIPRKSTQLILLFFGGIILFTLGLASQEVIGFDSRFYLFALEMWRNGANWFPTTYQQPYPDYPVTSTLLIYSFAMLWGGLNKAIAVLPTAICAALTLIVTYLIAARHSSRWGILGVCFLLMTIAFMKSARGIALDMYPTLFTTIIFYLVYSADALPSSQRLRWVYPLLWLGFIFRGPIGLVIPTGVMCIYYLQVGKWRQTLKRGAWAFLLLLLSISLLLLLAYAVGGHTFVQAVLRMEILGRIDNHFLPRYFYFTNSLRNYALSFPLAAFTLCGLLYARWRRYPLSPTEKLAWLLIGWAAVVLIGMSIPDDKKVRYILPMTPAIALLAAYPWAAPAHQPYFKVLRNLVQVLLLCLPTLFGLGLMLLPGYALAHTFNWHIHYALMASFCFLMQTIIFIAWYRRGYIDVLLVFISAAITTVIVNWQVIEPIELYIDRAHDFVQQVEKTRQLLQSPLVFYREQPDGLPIKYMANLALGVDPYFINNEAALLKLAPNTVVVASAAYFAELTPTSAAHFQIDMQDRLGHVPVVAFHKLAG